MTPFIWKKSKRYSLGTLFSSKNDYSNIRLTVDNQEDFDFIKLIYENLYSKDIHFTLDDVIEFIKQNQDLIKNKHLIGEEGYEDFWEK